MYPVPDGQNDKKWLKEQVFHCVEVFRQFGIAQCYACELIALVEWCHSCWNLMIRKYSMHVALGVSPPKIRRGPGFLTSGRGQCRLLEVP